MIKYIFYAILLVVAVGLLIGGFHLYRVSVKNKKEMGEYAGEKIEVNKNFGRVLVVYYSLGGHTRDIAMKIHDKVGGDIYEVKTLEKITTGPKLHYDIKEQFKSKNYPGIELDFPYFASYDVIFVGSPVWWYTVSTPMMSFLNQADFGGKKVVPFSTQGSNVGTFLEDFKAAAKNAELLDYAKFNNMSKEFDAAIDNKISVWLNGLDI